MQALKVLRNFPNFKHRIMKVKRIFSLKG